MSNIDSLLTENAQVLPLFRVSSNYKSKDLLWNLRRSLRKLCTSSSISSIKKIWIAVTGQFSNVVSQTHILHEEKRNWMQYQITGFIKVWHKYCKIMMNVRSRFLRLLGGHRGDIWKSPGFRTDSEQSQYYTNMRLECYIAGIVKSNTKSQLVDSISPDRWEGKYELVENNVMELALRKGMEPVFEP